MRKQSFFYFLTFLLIATPIIIFCEVNPVDVDTSFVTENPNDEDLFYHQFLHMLTILGSILVFLFGVTWFLKKFFSNRILQNNNSSIIVVERRQLTTKTTVYLLDIGGQGVLLAESLQGSVSLSAVPLPVEIRDENEEKVPPFFSLNKK